MGATSRQPEGNPHPDLAHREPGIRSMVTEWWLSCPRGGAR